MKNSEGGFFFLEKRSSKKSLVCGLKVEAVHVEEIRGSEDPLRLDVKLVVKK